MRANTIFTLLIIAVGLLFITGKAQSLSEKNTKTALVTARAGLVKKLKYGMGQQDAQMIFRQEGFAATEEKKNFESYRFSSAYVGFGALSPGQIIATATYKEGYLMSYKVGYVAR
jgi:hypothetical protein